MARARTGERKRGRTARPGMDREASVTTKRAKEREYGKRIQEIGVSADSAGIVGDHSRTADEAHAAEKPYMKKIGVKFDLKKNKEVKSKEKVVGVGNKNLKITVKNYKTAKLKNGKKKTTFTVVYDRSFKPTKKQVHKMNRSYDGTLFGGFWVDVVDYSTGSFDESVMDELGVSVKLSKWKYSKNKKFKDGDGCWVKYPLRAQVKVTITYPASYKGLCLGVGANSYFNPEGSTAYKVNQAHFEGKRPFGKTYMYKKGKTNSHWMRIK